MRTRDLLMAIGVWGAGPAAALAQAEDAEPAPAPVEDAPPVDGEVPAGDGGGAAVAEAQPETAPATEAPAAEPPPLFEPPPMPPPDADFRKDAKLFGEVETVAEQWRAQEIAREQAPIIPEQPFHREYPALSWTTQSTAGLFAAGAVGLLAGSIGGQIDEGDDRQPLGGFHGPVIGATVGSTLGAALGVWGSGMLVEKRSDPGWTLLGATAGTLVGGAAATGIASGLERSDAASGLAVATLLAFQVGGALLLHDLFVEEAPPSLPPVAADPAGSF